MIRHFVIALAAAVILLTQCACPVSPVKTSSIDSSTSSKASQPGEPAHRTHKMVTVPARLFLVIFDSSTSYKDYEAAIQGLIDALSNLGPGDQLVVARITEKLNPRDFTIVDGEWSANKPDENIFKPTNKIQQWKKRQQSLEALWQEADDSSQQVTAALENTKTTHTAPLTDLHGALEYSALWLNERSAAEKTLIVFSDLENDTGKPSFDPPAKSLDLSEVHVKLLYVSYRDAEHWQKIESAWRKYFSGARSFTMFDSGRSATALIDPNKTPRNLDHPFLTRTVD
jgi:hypothetical protein